MGFIHYKQEIRGNKKEDPVDCQISECSVFIKGQIISIKC